jgi:hypothetical protein
VNQSNFELFTKLNQRFRPKRSSIISENSAGTAKYGYDILQEADNNLVRNTPNGGCFYPLSEIVCCSQDQYVLAS